MQTIETINDGDRYKNQSFPKVREADCREMARHVHGALGSLHAAASAELPPALSEPPRPEAERPPGARPILRLKGDDPAGLRVQVNGGG